MGCAISDYHKFIFTHIPKTGGTSVFSRRSSVDLGPEVLIASGHTRLVNLGKKRDLRKYFKFTIVRNPWDRFISLWLTRDRKSTLDEFISKIKFREERWYALWPQTIFVCNKEFRPIVDCLLRYENYEEHLREVLGYFDIKLGKIPWLRKTARDTDYKKYYTHPGQIEFVKIFYGLDIINFGYTFDGIMRA